MFFTRIKNTAIIGVIFIGVLLFFSDHAFAAGRFCFMGICISDWSTSGLTAIDRNDSDNDGIINQNDSCDYSSAPGTSAGCPLPQLVYFAFDAWENGPTSKTFNVGAYAKIYYRINVQNLDNRDKNKYTVSIDPDPSGYNSEMEHALGLGIGEVVNDYTTFTLHVHAPGVPDTHPTITANIVDNDGDGISDHRDPCPRSYSIGSGCPKVSSKSFTFDYGGTTKEIYYEGSTAVNMKWSIDYANRIASSDEDKYWIEITNNPINDTIRTWRYGGSVSNLYASTTTTYILTLHGPGFDEEIGRVTANNPDSDGDGISRHADRCPDLSGYSDNDGCPNNSFGSWAKTDGSASDGAYCFNTRSANQPLNLSVSGGKIAGDELAWKSGCVTVNGSRNWVEAINNSDVTMWVCLKKTLRIAVEDFPTVTGCSGKGRRTCVDIAILCNWQDVTDTNIKTSCGVLGENGYRARKLECY